jgi:hypothetical protein
MTARRTACVTLAIACGLLAACGKKTMLLPPEAVKPSPPAALDASSAKDGVLLTWRRPTQYTGGAHMSDLGGFEIERAPADGPGGFANVGRIELDDQKRFRPQRDITWTDTTAVPGARYRYRVISFTLDGYESVASGTATVLFDPSKAPPPSPAAAK